MSRKPNLGLSWPYRKAYTPEEVARVRCAYDPDNPMPAGMRECIRERTTRYGEWSKLWVRRRVPTRAILSMWWDSPCNSGRVGGYVERRKHGARFPPVVLEKRGGPGPVSGPWYASDGNHRVRAAQCVGDKYIDAFVPVKKPPRKR